MGEVVAIGEANGSAKPVKQVYGCGKCEDQGHRLLEEGVIICGHPLCGAESSFLHYEPDQLRPGETHGQMKTLETREDKVVNYVCTRCRGNRFHLHPSGTLTCFRCRHSVPRKWWWPEAEGEA